MNEPSESHRLPLTDTFDSDPQETAEWHDAFAALLETGGLLAPV